MATIIGRGKPQGFTIMPEGEQNLHIIDVATASQVRSIDGRRQSTVTSVNITFENEAKQRLIAKYNLDFDGGYNALYYLILNGLGVDMASGEFDVENLKGKYVLCEIIHREGTKPKEDGTRPVFANIKRTISQGTAFGADTPAEVEDTSSEDLFA